MIIRKATEADIDVVEKLYDAIHTAEEAGQQTIGWIRGIYPVREIAERAFDRGELYVLEDDGEIHGTGIINNTQDASYANGNWAGEAPDDKVCVLHTLVIDPACSGGGYGKAFVAFYENYAMETGCTELRFDTNERNSVARTMYKKLGYTEAGIVKTDFNGLDQINLVLLEKCLGN